MSKFEPIPITIFTEEQVNQITEAINGALPRFAKEMALFSNVLDMFHRIYGGDGKFSVIEGKLCNKYGDGKMQDIVKTLTEHSNELDSISTETELFIFLNSFYEPHYRISTMTSPLAPKRTEANTIFQKYADGVNNNLMINSKYYTIVFKGKNLTFDQLNKNNADIIQLCTLLENYQAGQRILIAGNVENVLNDLGWGNNTKYRKRLNDMLFAIANMRIEKQVNGKVENIPFAKFRYDAQSKKIEWIDILPEYQEAISGKFPYISGGTSLKSLSGRKFVINGVIRMFLANKKSYKINFYSLIDTYQVPFNLKNPNRELNKLSAWFSGLPGIDFEAIIDGKNYRHNLGKMKVIGISKRGELNPELKRRVFLRFWLSGQKVDDTGQNVADTGQNVAD